MMSESKESVRSGETSPLTLEDQLTRQFYTWEKRGRGWKIWDDPVELEPPFCPFLFHSIPPAPVIDDARKPTFFSALADKILGKATQAVASSDDASSEEDFREPVPVPFDDDGELVELQVALPPALKTSKDATAQFLLGLTYSTCPLSFEIIGLPESVTVQLACRSEDRSELQQQLQAHFPESVLTERGGFLASHPFRHPGRLQAARDGSQWRLWTSWPVTAHTGSQWRLQAPIKNPAPCLSKLDAGPVPLRRTSS